MSIEMTPVISSNIAAIGYDEDKRELVIEFTNGSVYHYDSVPKDVFEGIMASGSKGQFFQNFIKRQYQYYREQ